MNLALTQSRVMLWVDHKSRNTNTSPVSRKLQFTHRSHSFRWSNEQCSRRGLCILPHAMAIETSPRRSKRPVRSKNFIPDVHDPEADFQHDSLPLVHAPPAASSRSHDHLHDHGTRADLDDLHDQPFIFRPGIDPVRTGLLPAYSLDRACTVVEVPEDDSALLITLGGFYTHYSRLTRALLHSDPSSSRRSIMQKYDLHPDEYTENNMTQGAYQYGVTDDGKVVEARKIDRPTRHRYQHIQYKDADEAEDVDDVMDRPASTTASSVAEHLASSGQPQQQQEVQSKGKLADNDVGSLQADASQANSKGDSSSSSSKGMVVGKMEVEAETRGAYLSDPLNDDASTSLGGASRPPGASSPLPLSAAQKALGLSKLPRHVSLKAYVYCVGRNELFDALWDLDLVDRVTWVDRVLDADVVIHRRPQPGEKQFYYDQYREEAKKKEIPFISIWEPTAEELGPPLALVLKLFAGMVSVRDVRQTKKGRGLGRGGRTGMGTGRQDVKL